MTAPFPVLDALPDLGGAPVADLRTLGDMQALAVTMMRDGPGGPAGMRRVRDAFVHTMGRSAGESAADAWTDFARFLVTEARRPLMCHALTCPCVGADEADEAVFALLLHLAATGAREDAMLILTLLVPADRALCAVALAEDAGLAVMRAARIAAQRPGKPNFTLH